VIYIYARFQGQAAPAGINTLDGFFFFVPEAPFGVKVIIEGFGNAFFLAGKKVFPPLVHLFQ
jgi:hypothetical protein